MTANDNDRPQVHADPAVLLELLAELETVIHVTRGELRATNVDGRSTTLPGIPPEMLQVLPQGPLPLPESLPVPQVPTTVVVETPQEPIANNPLVRNLLMLLPADMQMLLYNVLNSMHGISWFRVVLLCLAVIVLGVLTGHIAFPATVLEKVRSLLVTCPLPPTIQH